MKHLLLLTFIIISTAVYSNEPRLFQFISSEKNTSYIAFEVGTHIGLSIISKQMSLNLGYSFFNQDGYFISTDLYLYNKNISQKTSFSVGIGGGIIFDVIDDKFISNAYLRVPFKVKYRDFFCTASPILGTTMFEYNTDWIIGGFVGLGYQFDLGGKKRATQDNLELPTN